MDIYYKALVWVICWKKIFSFTYLYVFILYGISLGNILEKLKKKCLRFCMDVYYKALEWVICWRIFNFLFLRFCMDIYYEALVWVIHWRKLKKKKNFASLYGRILLGISMVNILEKIKKKIFTFLYGYVL
jgi:hypothetical protein